MKNLICLFLFSCYCSYSFSQEKNEYISFGLIGSVHFNSKRHEYRNGEQGIYKEIRVSHRFKNYFEIGLFAGHQWRSFIYYKSSQGSLIPLFMDRDYVPAGLTVRVYLTDVFFEKIRWIKNKEKWEVYNQLVISHLFGKDKRDIRETNQDNIVYLIPYVEEYGKVYLGLLLGATFYPMRNIGLFLEGGDGAIATLQAGIKVRL